MCPVVILLKFKIIEKKFNWRTVMASSGDENEVTFGTPTLEEWKRIFKKPMRTRPLEESPDYENDSELDDSLKQLLEKRRQEIEMSKDSLNEASPVSSKDLRSSYMRNSKASFGVGEDTTFFDEPSWMKTTDASFEEMERVCSMNETADTTLISNLSKESEEDKVLNRMLMADVEARKRANMSIGLSDITQLDDVEAPSFLFENSLFPAAGNTDISPLKRMHLLRPSTIIEENTINTTASSKNSSVDSYTTATQNENNSSASFTVSANTSALSGSQVFKTADEGDSKISINSSANLTGSFKIYKPKMFKDDSSFDSAYSRDTTKELTENIIEIISSSEDEDTVEEERHEKALEVEFEDKADITTTESLFDQQINLTDSILEEGACEASGEMNFNDTLERIDYMMSQGAKLNKPYMPASQLQTASKESSPVLSQTPATPVTPSYMFKKVDKNSPHCKQVLFPKNTNSTNKPNSNPGSFKKPSSRLPLPKVSNVRKQFDHIKSPIGAYIKNTPENLLSSNSRFHGRDLGRHLPKEYDRDSVIGAKENVNDSLTSHIPALPLKNVMKSAHKHTSDERKHQKIPGGPKVIKLLQGSEGISVIRHEGRLKTSKYQPKLGDDTIAESSFADLSVMSGDISVRVVKDARPA